MTGHGGSSVFSAFLVVIQVTNGDKRLYAMAKVMTHDRLRCIVMTRHDVSWSVMDSIFLHVMNSRHCFQPCENTSL